MLDQAEFLAKYELKRQHLRNAGLHWSDLEAIHDDYSSIRESLEINATSMASMLRKNVGRVHSIKVRVKAEEHLIEKIVRKKYRNIGLRNYKNRITDLIGIRALHLFKDDWIDIHKYIRKTWDLKQTPVANIRQGDPPGRTKAFKDAGCRIHVHEHGYRSLHYVIQSKPSKDLISAEIQVRTIFEEGWSEIDHQIRYPYKLDNQMVNRFLVIFNSLAGSADEMGSFIKSLQVYLEGQDKEHKEVLQEREQRIATLVERIDKMDIERKQKNYIKSGLRDIDRLASKHSSVKTALEELSKPHMLSHDVQMVREAIFSKDEERERP